MKWMVKKWEGGGGNIQSLLHFQGAGFENNTEISWSEIITLPSFRKHITADTFSSRAWHKRGTLYISINQRLFIVHQFAPFLTHSPSWPFTGTFNQSRLMLPLSPKSHVLTVLQGPGSGSVELACSSWSYSSELHNTCSSLGSFSGDSACDSITNAAL